MPLSITQTAYAVGPLVPASFLAVGGTAPYVYEVLPDGAGGAIDDETGEYFAPAIVSPDPRKTYDTIKVTDAAAATATAQILVGTPLILFCEIIQREMGLARDRVMIWDQKLPQPKDNDLWVAVSEVSSKPFGNNNRTAGVGSDLQSQAYVSMQSMLDIDVISRGPAARLRKEEVLLALNSIYSQQQQEINGFYIAKLPPSGGFRNLSEVDGAAIPYRFKISIMIQYCVSKNKTVDYFNDFEFTEYTDQ